MKSRQRMEGWKNGCNPDNDSVGLRFSSYDTHELTKQSLQAQPASPARNRASFCLQVRGMGGKGRSPVREGKKKKHPVEAWLTSPGSPAAVCRCRGNEGLQTAWEAPNKRPALGDYPLQRGRKEGSQVLLRHWGGGRPRGLVLRVGKKKEKTQEGSPETDPREQNRH